MQIFRFLFHPITQKIATIIGMIDRVMFLSHPVFQEKNFHFLIELFLSNNCLFNLIFHILNNRIKHIINNKLNFNNINNNIDSIATDNELNKS